MADQETDNMRIWNQVCETDPKHLKHVNARGGYEAICAQSQIKRATELWGPIGGRWGIGDQVICVVDGSVIYTADLWYPSGDGDRVCSFPIAADHVFKLNEDSVKKVRTDALTKGLSWIGFNSDVFEGKFDDNKYAGAPSGSGTPPRKPAAARQHSQPPQTPPAGSQQAPAGDGSKVLQNATFPCPSGCGGTMRSRNGANGWFFGCTNYPNCKKTVDRHAADQYVGTETVPPPPAQDAEQWPTDDDCPF